MVVDRLFVGCWNKAVRTRERADFVLRGNREQGSMFEADRTSAGSPRCAKTLESTNSSMSGMACVWANAHDGWGELTFAGAEPREQMELNRLAGVMDTSGR